MNLNKIKNAPTKILPQSYADIIQNSLVDEINIYGQAFLEQSRPLVVVSSDIHPKTSREMAVSFSLEGEIRGEIICLLDTFDKELESKELKFFQALFIESMNILLGQITTKVEQKYGILSLINSPRFFQTTEDKDILTETCSDYIKLEAGYTLISLAQEFNCRILFKLTPKKRETTL